MLKKLSIFIIFFLLFTTLSTSIFSQSSSDKPRKIKTDFLMFLLQQTDSHLMLKVKDGQFYALDSKRNTIYPAGYTAPRNEIFHVFKVNDLVELIRKKNNTQSKSFNKKNKKDNFRSRNDDEDDSVDLTETSDMECPPNCP